MTRRKCDLCGKDAFAYRIEADRTRTYLCLDHFPEGEASHPGEPQKKPPGEPRDPQP
jgi:hypothetical protein